MEEKKEKLSLKRGMGSEARAALASNVDVDSQLLTPSEQQRQRYKQKKRTQGSRESAVCFCVKLLVMAHIQSMSFLAVEQSYIYCIVFALKCMQVP